MAWRLSPLKELYDTTDPEVLRIPEVAEGIPMAANEILSEIIDGADRFNRSSLKGQLTHQIDIN